MSSPVAAVSPAVPAPDMTALLAELDDLTDRTAALRARLAAMRTPTVARPGWPIRRVGAGPGRVPAD